MKKLLIALAVVILGLPALAQSITGFQPFGTFQNTGPDSVNLADLNVHISLPIVSKSGIGLPFAASLNYDSSVYTPIYSYTVAWSFLNGLTFSSTANGSISVVQNGNCGQSGNPEWNVSGFYDGNDTFHPLHLLQPLGNSGTYITPCKTTSTATTTDGSGISFTFSLTGTQTITFTATYPSGVVATGTGDPPYVSATSITDPNGNSLAASGTYPYMDVPMVGTWTDTLGLQVLSASINGYANKFVYSIPGGANGTVTANFSPLTVQSSFGCSGINEFGPISQNLLTSLSLPDGSSYSFSYYTDGRLKTMTLPTGGAITYSYPGPNGGINCNDGTTMQLTRQTPDGTWTYTRSGNATTVRAPSGDYTVYTFSGTSTQVYTKTYETAKTVYSGTGATLLSTSTCYNGTQPPNCATATITLPITQTDVYTTLGGMSQSSRVTTTYDSYDNATDVKQYDFGASTPTLEIATPVGSWNNGCVPVSGSINNRTCYRNTYNGSSALQSSETFSYDSKGNLLTHVVGTTTSGISGPTLTSSFTYNSNGTVATSTDVNNAETSYAYNGAGGCNNGFVTSKTFVPLGLTTYSTWDCNGGVSTSSKDANGQTSSINYVGDGADPFWRPETATDPLGIITTFDYTPTTVESAMPVNGGNSTVTKETFLDGLGRKHVSQQEQGPSAPDWDTVSYAYDSDGRLSSTSRPCSAPSGSTCTTFTTQTYDGLTRPLVTTDGGGGTITRSYAANDVLVVLGPAPSGENAKQKQYQYDGLGRLISVCEISSASGSGSCGQANGGTGFLTRYTYDALGHLLSVTQNAQSGTSQTRTFTYDALGRMLTENNPESGLTQYFYDNAPSTPGVACPGPYNGDLVKKYDANGNTTCYAYDGLHRVTSVSYSGPNFDGNNKYFVYDAATVDNEAMGNAKGRLAETYTAASQNGTKTTDLGFNYSARGEVLDVYELTPHSGGYYHTTAGYWEDGALKSLSGVPGQSSWVYGVDGEGRPSTAGQGSQGATNLVTSATFNAASQPLTFSLGSGDSSTYQYDGNTGRMTTYTYTVGNPAQSITGGLTWNANGTLSKLAITDGFNSANTQTCKYGDPSSGVPGYDDLGRLIEVDCGATTWQQDFSYDAFGNVTKTVPTGGTGITWAPGYNLTNNHYALGGTAYDSDGNLANDTLHTYVWNQDNNLFAVDSTSCGSNGTCLTYDALGHTVEMNVASTYTEILYSPLGKTALMSGQTLQMANVALPGGATAVYNSTGLAYYRYPDWLGSSRLASTATPPAATPRLVQVNSATPQTNQSSVSVTFPSTQTAGNLNVVAVGWNDTTSSITSVTDSNGNGGGSQSPGSVTLVQKASNASCAGSSASCSVSVASTGSGHLLIVSAAWPGAFSISSVSGGGTWVCPANAVGADNGTLGSAMCYVLSSTSGATTITVTTTAVPNGGWTIEFREYNPTGTITFDTAGNVDDSTNCTSCSGVTLTLSGTNDLIVQLLNPTGSVTGISPGWGDTDFPGPDYIGIADEIQTSSGAAPTWTTNSGHASGAALAFQLGTVASGSGYTLAVGPSTGPGLSQAIYYAPNIKGGSNTVTVTFNQAATSVDIRVMEYSGVSTTDPLDVTAVGSGTSNGGNVATSTATTSDPNELIVGAGMTGWAYNAAGPGFTVDTITSPDTDIAEHEVVTSTGSYNASANLAAHSSTTWLMQMASFKAAISSSTIAYADVAYAPFGESYAQAGASDLSFTGQNNDTAGFLYDFAFRRYHPNQGRWLSPDPAGVAAADPMNPQSFNRYAYVMNGPLAMTDPTGLCSRGHCPPSPGDGVNASAPAEWNFHLMGDLESGCGANIDGGPLCFNPVGWSIFDWTSKRAYGWQYGVVDRNPVAITEPLPGQANSAAIIYTGWYLGPVDTTLLAANNGSWLQKGLDYLKNHPVFISVNEIVAGQITVQWSTKTVCANLGAGASVPPSKAVTVGVYNNGNMSNWTNVLSSWGYSFGANLIVGYQASTNSSGTIGGPTISGVGLSGSYTYGGCMTVP